MRGLGTRDILGATVISQSWFSRRWRAFLHSVIFSGFRLALRILDFCTFGVGFFTGGLPCALCGGGGGGGGGCDVGAGCIGTGVGGTMAL